MFLEGHVNVGALTWSEYQNTSDTEKVILIITLNNGVQYMTVQRGIIYRTNET